MTDTGRPRPGWILAVLAALLPSVAAAFLGWTLFGRSPLDLSPAYSNDETYYWLQINAFRSTGWNGGYHVVNERPALASFSPFGPHGPAYPVLYGILGRAFGWHPYSAPLFHALLVSLSLATYFRHARVSGARLAFGALFLATFWPLLLFLPSTMQEGAHFAIAIGLAVVFSAAFRPQGPSRGSIGCGALLLVIATLMRPSWGILWPVLLLLWGRPRRRAVAVVASAAIAVSLFWLYQWMAAPFPEGGFLFIKALRGAASSAEVADAAMTNVRRLLFRGNPLERGQRAVMIAATALSLAAVAVNARRSGLARREALLHAWNLGTILTLTVLFYIVGNWGDYRVFGTHLLLSALIALASPHRMAIASVGLITVVHLAIAPAFLMTFRNIRAPHFQPPRAERAAFAEALGRHLAYRSRERWCNTILSTTFPFFDPAMTVLPAGFGVGPMFTADGLDYPIRSGYVLFGAKHYGEQTWMGRRQGTFELTASGRSAELTFDGERRVRLELVVDTHLGGLYRNLDANCANGAYEPARSPQ